MTLTAIISLVRDAIILIAVGLLIWLLITFGKDLVKVADMKALQKQLEKNVQIEAQWRKDQDDANLKHDEDLAKVNARIADQRAPVLVCRRSPAPQQLPANPGQASGGPAATGGTDAGTGGDSLTVVDVRSQLNPYELKVEKIVADCRRAIDGWPKPQ